PCTAVSQTSIALNFHRPCSHRSLPSHGFRVLLRRTPSVGLAYIAPFQTLMCVSLFDLATSACSFLCVDVFLSLIFPQLCRAYDRAAIKFCGIDADINFNVSDYDEDIKQSTCSEQKYGVNIINWIRFSLNFGNYWGNVNPNGVRSCYDEGKRMAETLMFDYHRQHGI
ncbi:hypothetical protein S83_029023, partial [Arachis hypogaea]